MWGAHSFEKGLLYCAIYCGKPWVGSTTGVELFYGGIMVADFSSSSSSARRLKKSEPGEAFEEI